jgi:hypothetical protein
MRYTLLFSILLLSAISCTKEKYSSTPSLKFESVNTTGLHNQQLLTFTLSFEDAEGDIMDSIYVQEIVPNCAASNLDGLFPIPVFPTSKNQKGTINVNLGYNLSNYTSISPQCQQNDTAVFRFALRDLSGHVSDTVSSPPVILYYP